MSDDPDPLPEQTRTTRLAQAIRRALAAPARWAGRAAGGAADSASQGLARVRGPLTVCAVAGAAGWGLWTHPPMRTVPRGDIGVRASRLSGEATLLPAGSFVVLPGLQDLSLYPLGDQVYRPSARALCAGR